MSQHGIQLPVSLKVDAAHTDTEVDCEQVCGCKGDSLDTSSLDKTLDSTSKDLPDILSTEKPQSEHSSSTTTHSSENSHSSSTEQPKDHEVEENQQTRGQGN